VSRLAALRSARDRAEHHVRDCERRLDDFASIMDPGNAGGLQSTLADAERCLARSSHLPLATVVEFLKSVPSRSEANPQSPTSAVKTLLTRRLLQ
jgi:hypothetical protein